MAQFTLNILAPDGKQLQLQANRVSLPTEDGVRTVLANHMDTIIPIIIGKIMVRDESNQAQNYAVSEGLFYFQKNHANLMVRSFEHPDEIDRVRASRALERAKEHLENKESQKSMQRAELALKRALTRLSLK